MTLIFFLGMVASLVLQFLASAGNKHLGDEDRSSVPSVWCSPDSDHPVACWWIIAITSPNCRAAPFLITAAGCCIQHRGVSIQWQIGTNTEQRHTKIAKPGQNGQNTGSIRAHSCNNYIREKRLCCSPLLTPQPCSCSAACVRDEA